MKILCVIVIYIGNTSTFNKDVKGVARIFGMGSAIWSEATYSATCFAGEAALSAANQATAVVRGATPFWDLGKAPVVG